MKLIGALLGGMAAWALYKFAPETAALFFAPTNPAAALGAVGAIAAVLSAPWAASLSRLSVFERLDELQSTQTVIVQQKSRSMRRFIIRSIIVNALTLVFCIVALTFEPKAALNLYLVCVSLGVWLVGLAQAYRCWIAAEESRIAIAAAQTLERNKKKYLEEMRADDRKTPVDRKDPHLNGYAKG